MIHSMEYTAGSTEETLKLGRKLASILPQRAIITLSGPLGAGKTTLVQGIASVKTAEPVTSPTFTYHQRYTIDDSIIDHVDLYRTYHSPENLGRTGVLDLLEDVPGWLFIEWPLAELSYPTDVVRIQITATGQPDFVFRMVTDDEQIAVQLKDLQ